MEYKEIDSIAVGVDQLIEIFMLSKKDLDNIESDKRFVIIDEDGENSYYVFKDNFVYKFPGLSDEDFKEVEEESKFVGKENLQKARAIANNFLEGKNIKHRLEKFIVEEYLISENIDVDEKLFDVVVRMIDSEIDRMREESWEESSGIDIEKEKEYMNLLMKTAEQISQSNEFKNASTEMAKTMVVKKFIVDNNIQIRNRNSPNEIKALIISYFS